MSTTTTSFSPKEVAALAERLRVADEVDLLDRRLQRRAAYE